MFEDSTFDSSGKIKTKKPATVVVSFLLQVTIIGIMILIPLIYTEALPKRELLTFLMAPPPPPPPPPPPAPAPKVKIIPKVQAAPQEMVQPKAIPRQVAMIKEEAVPTNLAGGVVGGVGESMGSNTGMMSALSAAPPPPPPPPPPPERVRVGGSVQGAKLVSQAKPVYPPLARQARIQGTVRLEADISKDGTIENLKVISGHPLLIQAALDAVKQWRYQPTMLNGVAVEVVTTVDVNFTLGG